MSNGPFGNGYELDRHLEDYLDKDLVTATENEDYYFFSTREMGSIVDCVDKKTGVVYRINLVPYMCIFYEHVTPIDMEKLRETYQK